MTALPREHCGRLAPKCPICAAQASSKWWETAFSHPNSERSSLTGGPELLSLGEGGQPRMRQRSHMSHSPSSTIARPPEVQAAWPFQPACLTVLTACRTRLD